MMTGDRGGGEASATSDASLSWRSVLMMLPMLVSCAKLTVCAQRTELRPSRLNSNVSAAPSSVPPSFHSTRPKSNLWSAPWRRRSSALVSARDRACGSALWTPSKAQRPTWL